MVKIAFRLIPLLALLLPVIGGTQTPLQRVVVTYSSGSIASIDLFVAQERGFFRDEGLEPQLVQVPANVAIAALVAGDAQALGSVGSVIRAIPRGAPELKSFNDLRGKVMGTTTIGGSNTPRAYAGCAKPG